ncbi:hypothetical protein HS041_29630 [Planomonospora sp. ID67723]|uniref:hypothetical protein n=1 Tax=Planomonospora sp. ID67723 TaxID=2738134 RepID=UPI0018C448D2|nr:hypothetical protein [Planomonospora sp. ID67723]MBG0831875.1 hypothetical protein [Planomonospora sp. ID67723]
MEQTWRVSLALRIVGVGLFLVLLGVLAFVVMIIISGFEVAPVASVLGLVGLVPLMRALLVKCLLDSIRPWIRLNGEVVIIRNPLSTHRIPLAQIASISAHDDGITIETHAGRVISAWAVQKSNLATWLGWHTRADRVADRLREVVIAARSQQGHLS